MFKYTSKLIGPLSVEFVAPTGFAYRVVRVYLDNPSAARFIAFIESSGERIPATIWENEIETLIKRARKLCNPQKEKPE